MENYLAGSFLYECKNLYQMSIHPFDFDKIDTHEYQELITTAKKFIKKFGVIKFAEFMVESQYRVYVWAAYLTLKLENDNPNILYSPNRINTIKDNCIEIILRKEIKPLPEKIVQNKQAFISNL